MDGCTYKLSCSVLEFKNLLQPTCLVLPYSKTKEVKANVCTVKSRLLWFALLLHLCRLNF